MKQCRICKEMFSGGQPLARVCSPACALSIAVSKRGKAAKVARVKERKADAMKRDGMKSRGQWIAEAQAVFNGWVRARDAGMPCICCGRYSTTMTPGGTWDAGHYRSRGSAPHLRFDERNVMAQLKYCNRYASGNVVGYRLGLIERIGLEAVEALESDQTPRKHTIDDLRAIKAIYTAKTKQIKRAQ